MNHTDYVDLLRPAGLPPGGIWADLGAGTGAFTLALRDLLGVQAHIHAVDREGGRLKELERSFHSRFGNTDGLNIMVGDFSKKLNLPLLDGFLMANSLHFYRDKASLLKLISRYLKVGGRFLLVEYNVDDGNMWVPHPISFKDFPKLAKEVGFGSPILLGRHPSRFLREFYSAVAIKEQGQP
jgi:ubiquinone/menaquinone biosynthesis C-methylase UbiE